MSRPADRSVPLPAHSNAVLDYLELTKPRITFMVIISTAGGYLMGTQGLGSIATLMEAVVGTALVAASASTLNQWLERDTDGLMERTRNRPLPAGRLEASSVMIFGILIGALGIALLALLVNQLTAALALATLLIYVLVYTPMKRMSSLCTIVGAIPGALPPVIGWAAARNDLSTGSWILFAILFLWQMPHFLAIAWMYREEYESGGQPMLPVIDPEGVRTGRQIVLYCLALLPVSLLPGVTGLSGPLYSVGALILGIAYLAAGLFVAKQRTTESARVLFRVSLIYLPILLGLMAMSRVIH